jgi:hypothetical protein
MSAASDALLRWLFAEGALPAQAPPLGAGELRVAGATLSTGVARLYRRERPYWTKCLTGRISSGRWLKPHGAELPPGVCISRLRTQLAKLFGIPEVRRRRRTPRSATPLAVGSTC